MKRIIATTLICLLLIGAMLVLVSCGGGAADGTYVSVNGTVEISGTDFVIKTEADGEQKYTYEIKADDGDPSKQKIYLTGSDGVTHNFYYEEIDNGFKFNGVKYTKK